MVKLIMGLTGSGKTKTMVSMVNEAIQNESGDVVCVERGKTLTYDIPRRVRLVSTEEFGINTNSLFQGFLTGLHAANFDITHVFVDCFYKILDDNSNEAVEKFLAWLEAYSERENVNFTLFASNDPEKVSDTIKKFF